MIKIAHVATEWKPGKTLRHYFIRKYVTNDTAHVTNPQDLEQRVAKMLHERVHFGLPLETYLEDARAHATRLIMRGYRTHTYGEITPYRPWNAPAMIPIGAFA